MHERSASDVVIRSRRVLTPAGIGPAALAISGGRIQRISEWSDASVADLVDVGDLLVMPGIIDTHVHVNEPGRTHWEGFASASRAAAAGGVTTILDMPLNSVPATTTVAALELKRAAARNAAVNVEYIGGVVPGNAGELEGLAASGVRAFKCFLSPSGVEEFPCVGEADLRDALPVLKCTGLPLMVHAEDPGLLGAATSSSREYSGYLASRPVHAERSAVDLMIRLADEFRTRIHIVHLSSASSLDIIDSARARGIPVTVETCPHYLTFAAEEIPDGATEYKCAPPIRSAAERRALWDALSDGRIDLVASDHSPCPPEMKDTEGDFFAAWGGIASLQLSLSAVWTGARARGLAVEHLSAWMSSGTARIAGIADRRGKIEADYAADLVIWNPDEAFVVRPERLRHRHKLTPYAGMTLYGAVKATYVNGRCVFTS